ncbi:MAG: rhodanese-like domain-containing protein [Bacteroidota bacterium]
MIGLLSKLLGLTGTQLGPTDLQNGSIIDVRTPAEFKQGHVKGSINIPLQEIDQHLASIKKMKSPVISCCASGNRSGMAARKLEAGGIKVINGGSWQNVANQLEAAEK